MPELTAKIKELSDGMHACKKIICKKDPRQKNVKEPFLFFIFSKKSFKQDISSVKIQNSSFQDIFSYQKNLFSPTAYFFGYDFSRNDIFELTLQTKDLSRI